MVPVLVPTLDELAVEFERVRSAYRCAAAASHAAPLDHELDHAADEACSRLAEICNQIAELPPQTWEHVRLVARALEWSRFPRGFEQGEDRLVFVLMRAIIDGVEGGAQ